MNRLEDHLRKISKPNLDLPLNHKALHKFFLKKLESRSNPLLNMSIYKIIPAGFALVIIVALTTKLIFPSVNAAEALVDDSLQKIESMTPADLERVKQTINFDSKDELIKILNNAKSAKDLSIVESKTISCDEVNEIKKSQIQPPDLKAGTSDQGSNVKINIPGMNLNTSENGVQVNMPGMKIDTTGGNTSVNMKGGMDISVSGQGKEVANSNIILIDQDKSCQNPIRWDFLMDGDSKKGMALVDVNTTKSSSVTYLAYTQNGSRMILGLSQAALPLVAVDTSAEGATQAFVNGVMLEETLDSVAGDEDDASEDTDLDVDIEADDQAAEDLENTEDEVGNLDQVEGGLNIDISDPDKNGDADVNVDMPGLNADVSDNGDGSADVELNLPGMDINTSNDGVQLDMPGINIDTGGF